MEQENQHWISKTKVMEKVSLLEIAQAQNEINAGKGTFVVATQVFQRQLYGENFLYDALIYYKVDPRSVAGEVSKPMISQELEAEIFGV